MNLHPVRFALVLVCLPAPSALASSSAWFEMEGGALRLVTSGLAGDDGRLRGAIEIALEPGWKTYWRDPGSSGVPPQIEVGRSLNVSGAELHFPAPELHEDGYGAWAGYGRSVTLPVTFSVPQPDRFSLVEADLFLGICETICVPVQAELSVEPGDRPDDPADAGIVEAAFASLPAAASDDFGIVETEFSGDTLVVEAAVPASADGAELFIAGSRGFMFGPPAAVEAAGGKATFTVAILDRPIDGTGGTTLPYTLVAGGRAVSGELHLP